MSKRIAAYAIVAAAIVIAAGVAAWQAHVRVVRSTLETQRAVASVLLDAGARNAHTVILTVARPGLHVIVEDHDNGEVQETMSGRIDVRPAGAPPPETGPPGAPPGMRPAPPLNQFVGSLARIAPVRIDGDALSVVITPDINALKLWLFTDTAICLLLVAVITGTAIASGARLAGLTRARLEATLEERRAAAAEFQRFLGDAGHELRTPLTIVSGYSEILARRFENSDDEDIARLLRGMHAETTRMRALVEKMLLLARLESPASVPRLVDIESVAEEAVNAMNARFPDRDVEITGGGGAAIVIDRDDLYEALHNLVENALKYAPGSPVEVRTGVRDGHAVVSVADRGPGIAPGEQASVFERFYRGSERNDTEGSGLGLAIVKRVADRWNGAVELESHPGMTAFTLTFPLAVEEAP